MENTYSNVRMVNSKCCLPDYSVDNVMTAEVVIIALKVSNSVLILSSCLCLTSHGIREN